MYLFKNDLNKVYLLVNNFFFNHFKITMNFKLSTLFLTLSWCFLFTNNVSGQQNNFCGTKITPEVLKAEKSFAPYFKNI